MREENFPSPVSDPEADGLPGTADDDSTAYDDVASGREADGPHPAALPSEEPVGVNRYGTTAAEQRRGTSLDQRLAEEEPDSGAAPDDGADLGDEADLDGEEFEGALDADPVYDPHSKVSVYDRPEYDAAGRPVGRLVEPDQGVGPDEEKDLIAYDAGAAGGGASAEELAMHEFRPPT